MLTQTVAEPLEAKSPMIGSGLPRTSLGPRRACRVLLVDDDDVVRTCLAALLKRAHYDVIIAPSGEEAVQLLSATQFDILLTDWQMPNMNGITLCSYVRCQYHDYIYVLLLTVRDSPEDRQAGISAGADEYVVKEWPTSELLERLNAGRRITQERFAFRSKNRVHNGSKNAQRKTNARKQLFFSDELPRAIARARHNRHALAILSCHIDGLDQATNLLGYGVREAAYRAFVADSIHCLRQPFRWIARVGPNRFIIVLPNTRFKCAAKLAGTLRGIFAVPVTTPIGAMHFSVSIVVNGLEPKHCLDRLPLMRRLLSCIDESAQRDRVLSNDFYAAQKRNKRRGLSSTRGGRFDG